MKPKTKRQFRVCQLSSELPDIAKKLEPWAFKNCIEHIGHRNKLWTSCLSCGYVWPTTSMTIKTEKCTGCGYKLKLSTTMKQKSSTFARFAVMDYKDDFQIIRYFNISCDMKTKQMPRYHTREIMQHWILSDGTYEIISSQVGGLGLSYDHFGSHMSLKNSKDLWKYNIVVDKIYPKMKLDPIIKRNGFTSALVNVRPFTLLKNLTSDPKAETLLKSGQHALLSEYLSDRHYAINAKWSSIKICIRQGYKVKEAGIWLDYIDLLQWFNRDLHNAKYVCPINLHKEHNRLVNKKNKITAKREIEQRKAQSEIEQKAYASAKATFFGLVFTEKNLVVKVLESVEEFIIESQVHKHCVYSNRYYTKKNSLCFSAQVKGQPVETVEIDLNLMKVVQSRGMQNRPSEYHQRIIDLVNKNMNQIVKRIKRKEAA
jgi:hypothetical protein